MCVFARVGTTRTSTPRYCDPCVSITLKFRFPSFTTRQSTMDFRLPLFYVFNTNNDESFNEQSTRGAHTKRDNFYAPFCPSQLVPNFCFFDSWISFSTKIKCNDLFELYFRCNYGASNNYTTRHRMNRKFYIYIYIYTCSYFIARLQLIISCEYCKIIAITSTSKRPILIIITIGISVFFLLLLLSLTRFHFINKR